MVEQQLSKEELRALVAETVKQTLTSMGVDTSDPLAMQRDFQHLRDWRMAQEAIRSKGRLVLVSIVVTGAISLLWVGLKDLFLRVAQ